MMLDFSGADQGKGVNYVPEFQSVILCGPGSMLDPLAQDDHPKALLPVANKPMLHYPIAWLERAGVSDALIVTTSTDQRERIEHYLSSYEGPLALEVFSDPQWNQSAAGETPGSADALRIVKDKIKRDFIVIGCCLITDIEPRILLDAYRVTDPTMSALFFEPVASDLSLRHDKPAPMWVGVDADDSRLVYLELIGQQAGLELRRSLVRRFPRMNILTNLCDASLYVFKRWVIDVIAHDTELKSLGADVVPLLVKCQWNPKLAQRKGIDKYTGAPVPMVSSAEHLAPTRPASSEEQGVYCRIHVARPAATMELTGLHTEKRAKCGRANHISGYHDMNRLMSKYTAVRIAETAKISEQKTQIGSDSLVGDSTTVGPRSSVKRSTIGDHVELAENVKVDKSVVMDHVKLGKNVTITGCIIGSNAVVESGCNLTQCVVGPGYTVPADVQLKDELLRKDVQMPAGND